MVTTARRVLVIGRVAAVNQRVVLQIAARGHVAVGAAGEGSFPGLDARDHDVVAIGSGVDPGHMLVVRVDDDELAVVRLFAG